MDKYTGELAQFASQIEKMEIPGEILNVMSREQRRAYFAALQSDIKQRAIFNTFKRWFWLITAPLFWSAAILGLVGWALKQWAFNG